jgi:hypothetical protein
MVDHRKRATLTPMIFQVRGSVPRILSQPLPLTSKIYALSGEACEASNHARR